MTNASETPVNHRTQMRAALGLLFGMALPNTPEHKSAKDILADLFETLAADWHSDELALDDAHERWVWEWARDQWESMPALGGAPAFRDWEWQRDDEQSEEGADDGN